MERMGMVVGAYCGCGKCMLGVRRLSRRSDATSSPERQEQQIVSAVASIGGHIIGWADDWEVSGATDPRTRPELGPWLRDEMGPYSGIAGAAVDRIGRNQRDVLNTAYAIHEAGRLLVTFGHDGPWNLDDPADEMRLSMESFGAQMELRAIQKRNRDDTVRARAAGEPKQKNSPRKYGRVWNRRPFAVGDEYCTRAYTGADDGARATRVIINDPEPRKLAGVAADAEPTPNTAVSAIAADATTRRARLRGEAIRIPSLR